MEQLLSGVLKVLLLLMRQSLKVKGYSDMQKIINIVAIASGAVSIAVVGSGLFIYLQRDQLINKVKSQVLESVTGSLPSLVDTKLPSMTGPASPIPSAGLGISFPR